jgi:hypothetical protein
MIAVGDKLGLERVSCLVMAAMRFRQNPPE